MPGKLKLNLEDLQVDSFVTSVGSSEENRGTVHAHDTNLSCWSHGDNSNEVWPCSCNCPPTGYTCDGYYTCGMTCAETCTYGGCTGSCGSDDPNECTSTQGCDMR